MAAKRLRDCSDEEQEDQRKIRKLPSFSTVIKETMMANALQKLFFSLEPLLRKVVKEEVEQGLVRCSESLQISSTRMQTEAPESSTLKLMFAKSLSVPIFTGSKIEDSENSPLQIILVDTSGEQVPLSLLTSGLKLEVVALDGDFPAVGDTDNWTSKEFQSKIVKERTGRRPLLTGDVSITLRDGTAYILELCFTDNSSWIRSRNFRIGVRIVPGSYDGPRIREAVTEAFMVKDHRGELYKKHYPPGLGDEVWRLERIGKDGAFHKKLANENINTVQDFLKLWAVDPTRLRNVLGVGMSDRMWEGTIGHAKTCELGNKVYLHHATQTQCTLVLNPVCEIVRINFPGNISYTLQELNNHQKSSVKQLVQEAYNNWELLEESEGYYNHNIAVTENVQLPQIEMQSLHWYQTSMIGYQFGGYEDLDSAESFYN